MATDLFLHQTCFPRWGEPKGVDKSGMWHSIYEHGCTEVGCVMPYIDIAVEK